MRLFFGMSQNIRFQVIIRVVRIQSSRQVLEEPVNDSFTGCFVFWHARLYGLCRSTYKSCVVAVVNPNPFFM